MLFYKQFHLFWTHVFFWLVKVFLFCLLVTYPWGWASLSRCYSISTWSFSSPLSTQLYTMVLIIFCAHFVHSCFFTVISWDKNSIGNIFVGWEHIALGNSVTFSESSGWWRDHRLCFPYQYTITVNHSNTNSCTLYL